MQLAVSGPVLTEMFPDKVEEIMLKVRERLAKAAFKRESSSYWLLLALDLYHQNWLNFAEPLATFYASRLGKNTVNQLSAASVAMTPSSTTSSSSQSSQKSSSSGGGRTKEYWHHDDRVNEVKPQGRPLHGRNKDLAMPKNDTHWN